MQHCLNGDIGKCHAMRGSFSGQALPKTAVENIGEALPIDTPIEMDYYPFIRRLDQYFPKNEVTAVLPLKHRVGGASARTAHSAPERRFHGVSRQEAGVGDSANCIFVPICGK